MATHEIISSSFSSQSSESDGEVFVSSNTSTSECSTSSNSGFEEINNATSTIQPYQYQPLVQGHAAAGASSNA